MTRLDKEVGKRSETSVMPDRRALVLCVDLNAIHAMAPTCGHCNSRIVGHRVEEAARFIATLITRNSMARRRFETMRAIVSRRARADVAVPLHSAIRCSTLSAFGDRRLGLARSLAHCRSVLRSTHSSAAKLNHARGRQQCFCRM
jgi:hypothetical protein